MNAVLRYLVLFGCFVVLATPALADIPSPDGVYRGPARRPEPELVPDYRPPGKSARMVVEVNESGVTQLRIPEGLLSDKEELSSDTSRLRTIVAGIALSLAAVSLVFVRKRAPARRIAVVLLVVATTLGIAGVVSLSAATPPQESQSPKGPDGLEVLVESTSDDHITLSISRDALERLMPKSTKAVKASKATKAPKER